MRVRWVERGLLVSGVCVCVGLCLVVLSVHLVVVPFQRAADSPRLCTVLSIAPPPPPPPPSPSVSPRDLKPDLDTSQKQDSDTHKRNRNKQRDNEVASDRTDLINLPKHNILAIDKDKGSNQNELWRGKEDTAAYVRASGNAQRGSGCPDVTVVFTDARGRTHTARLVPSVGSGCVTGVQVSDKVVCMQVRGQSQRNGNDSFWSLQAILWPSVIFIAGFVGTVLTCIHRQAAEGDVSWLPPGTLLLARAMHHRSRPVAPRVQGEVGCRRDEEEEEEGEDEAEGEEEEKENNDDDEEACLRHVLTQDDGESSASGYESSADV